MQQNLSNHTFKTIIQKTDKNGNKKYRIYMKNGEVLFLEDNEKFHREYCPYGVNVISEVIKEKYL